MEELTVFRTWDETMADMAVNLLRAEGIHARKLADMPRSVYPVNVDGLGEIEIVVPVDEAPDALDILAARFSEEERGETGDEGVEFQEDEDDTLDPPDEEEYDQEDGEEE